MHRKIESIKEEISKVVVGQEGMIDALLIGLFSNGHILLEGVPGLAKTTAVNALSSALGLDFKRVQFTPDLLPSDIVGTQIYNPVKNEFALKKGPIFANLLLADEINRAPAKVQSALLEAMQERQVTIGEESFSLPAPFLTLATQNPVESEGVYNLPEAQLDRFMMKIVVGYNTKEEELEIARRVTLEKMQKPQAVVGIEDIFAIKEEIKNIHIDPEVENYIINLISASREGAKYGFGELISFGSSPRGTIDLFKASKAHAYLKGKDFVSPVDISMVVHNVLRHRIVVSYEAEAREITSEQIIDKILRSVDVP
jgi:MoxR-like ATPase